MNSKFDDIVSFSHKLNGFSVSARNKIAQCDCSGQLVRAAPALLVPVNMLLMLYSGAALATGARLAWDPSAFLPLRAFLPREYRSALMMLPVLAGASIAITFWLLFALRLRRLAVKRATLFTYAALMAALMASEVAYLGWLLWRVLRWLASKESDIPRHLLRLLSNIESLFEYLGEEDIPALIEETKTNAMKNLHVALWSSVVLAALQVTAVALTFCVVQSLPFSKPPVSRADAVQNDKIIYL